jgi:hypothetical protein
MNDIPRSLRQRPRWQGVPVPYTTVIRADGTPDFKSVDRENLARCLTQRLCGLCGERLKEVIVFIGGPKGVEGRLFTDPPMHEDCALYAVKACPFLADAAWDGSNVKHRDEVVRLTFEQKPTPRPARMALVYCRGYEAVQERDGSLLFRAWPPLTVDWDTIPSRSVEGRGRAQGHDDS